MASIPPVAAFDFDGTLTWRDTLLPFFCFLFGVKKTAFKLLMLLPELALFPLGLRSRVETKERILTAFLQNMPLALIEDKGKSFAEGPLARHLKPQALERLLWHKSQGHTCILISANFPFFLGPWARKMGFHHLISSKAAVDADQRITGKLEGLNCYGQEKVERLKALLGPRSDYLLYAYGDSQGDKELLLYADYPFFRKYEE